jgi:hypothetical protein
MVRRGFCFLDGGQVLVSTGASRSHLIIVIPAKAGIHRAAISLLEQWIPAFAGMTT